MKINKTKKTMKDALDLLNDCGYYLCDICDEFYDKENREETCMDCEVEL